jgi:Flp pilus assembly pilin Flp
MLKNFWNDESGMIISAELVLVLTICVIGVIVGLSHVAMAINEELSDIAQAIGSIDQSYSFAGYKCCSVNGLPTAATAGSYFIDSPDHCDCQTSCDLVVPPTPVGPKSAG